MAISLPWLGGVLAVVLIGLALITQLLLVQAPKRNHQQLVQQVAQQEAALLDFALTHYQHLAQSLAENPNVNRTLLTPGAASLSHQLSRVLAPAKVFLVSDNDPLAKSRLSFLQRDLLGKASAGKPVIQLTAGKNSKLLMVYRSKNEAGAILMVQPLQPLWAKVKQLAPARGALEVKQGGLTLVSSGSLKAGVSSQGVASLGITVTVAQPVRTSLIQQPLFLIVAVAMVVLVALLLWLLVRQLSSRLASDSDTLVKRIKRLATGKKPGGQPPSLTAFRDIDSALPALASAAGTPREGRQKDKYDDGLSDIVQEKDMSMLVREEQQAAAPSKQAAAVPAEIFRAYDIRGIVDDTLSVSTVKLIGQAIGTEAGKLGQQTVLVARDGRLSGPKLVEALADGLRAAGRDVIDIGDVPTPVLYYATKVMATQTGVCVTGSHNPENYNGLKIVLNGEAIHGERITGLYDLIASGDFSQGEGSFEQRDISGRYLTDVLEDVVLARPMKVVIDCGNGIAGNIAPGLFRELGCTVVDLYCEVDGHFPNHHPDPGKAENLVDLIKKVQAEKADIGLAFDGDGDRLGVVTPKGEIIWPDRLMMLFARDLLSRSPGIDIIFDVKCSRALPALIRRLGGRPLMWKTGHSLIKAKLRETSAPLAGEMSGHLFFADRWYGVDDGLYAAARLLEILSLEQQDADTVFSKFKTGLTTPELNVDTTEEAKFRIVEQLCQQADSFSGGSATTLDGLRVDFPDGWGLIRASNTTPKLVARFEGKDEAALERIKKQFHQLLASVDGSLTIPF